MPDLFDPPRVPQPRTARGHRLPDDWQPTPEARQYAIGLGLEPDTVAEAFRDYWCDQVGARARRMDWLGTWRTWCRRAAEYSGKGKTPSSGQKTGPAVDPESEWWPRLRNYRPGGFWSAMWGPRPSPVRGQYHPLIPKADVDKWWDLLEGGT